MGKEKIHTWFEVGYFLDRLKSAPLIRPQKPALSKEVIHAVAGQGIAFLTYGIGADGVSVEMFKYATALRQVLGQKAPIHWIAGKIDTSVGFFSKKQDRLFEYPPLQGFELWGEPYRLLFHTKLKRGDDNYNELPDKIWTEAKNICRDLLEYVEKNNIEFLLVTNVASNPGNISFQLALVIMSELYGLTVISSNHDFYWESGSPKNLRKKAGPRDHFYTNVDLTEIFSLIQMLYPWSSPRWIHANINSLQKETVINKFGFNPFHITELTSAIDTKVFRLMNANEKELTYKKLQVLFKYGARTVNPEDKGYLETLVDPKPVIITNSRHPVEFGPQTIMLFQPTRVTGRKRIERDLILIERLFFDTPLRKKNTSIVLLITGPVSTGSEQYAKRLLVHTRALFRRLKKYDHKIYVAFRLGVDTHPKFAQMKLSQMSMEELYGVASLALLPSDQENRGLPILESAASQVPLITSKFEPKEVYREVLGLDLEESMKMNVLEMPTPHSSKDSVQTIFNVIEVGPERTAFTQHNHDVVGRRYSTQKLKENFEEILEKTWLINRDHSVHQKLAIAALAPALEQEGDGVSPYIYNKNRTYIPGILKYRFLSQIKSIVDPSYFRIEEKQTLSNIFRYSLTLVPSTASEEEKELFFHAIECLFKINKGKHTLELDTTYDYRYRNNTKYLWRELTEPRLFGVLVRLAESIYGRPQKLPPYRLISLAAYLSQDTALVAELTNHLTQVLVLDSDILPLEGLINSHKLAAVNGYKESIVKKLQTPLVVHDIRLFQQRIIDKPQSLIIVPGNKDTIIWELFAYDQIVRGWDAKHEPYRIAFACREHPFNNDVTLSELRHIINANSFKNLKAAFDKGQVVLIPVGSKSSSIDLTDVSPELKKELARVKKAEGHVLAKGEQNYFSLDLLDIDSFRYGTLQSSLAQAVFGVHAVEGFLQFVPAGFRTFFGFPLTTETPQQFSKVLNDAYSFQDSSNNKQLLNSLKIYLDEHGMSLRNALKTLALPPTQDGVIVKRLAGKYADGYAWTGVSVTLKPDKKGHSYHIVSSKKNRTLPQFARALTRRYQERVLMGWNGGYILNNELVGKLRVSEHFTGTPLGFVVSNGRVLSLPLFNRPVFAVTKEGDVFIKKIQLDFPGRIYLGKKHIFSWKKKYINPTVVSKEEVAVYTPLAGLKKIPSAGRIIVVMGGRKIIRVLYPEDRLSGYVNFFPAGITFSLPLSMRERMSLVKPNTEMRIQLDLEANSPWLEVDEAMEGGPQLIEKGVYNTDLKGGGWLLENSIKTQTGRRDRENNRWPLIGCGITKNGSIVAVVVESRIRESIGATNAELAEILIREGAEVALGFDSGGSASLWAENGIVNIVPYTSTYNENPFTGKSEPRPVGNAVLIRGDSLM